MKSHQNDQDSEPGEKPERFIISSSQLNRPLDIPDKIPPPILRENCVRTETEEFVVLSSQINRTIDLPHKDESDSNVKAIQQILQVQTKETLPQPKKTDLSPALSEDNLERSDSLRSDLDLKTGDSKLNINTSYESGYLSQGDSTRDQSLEFSFNESALLSGKENPLKAVANKLNEQLDVTLIRFQSIESIRETPDDRRQQKMEELRKKPFFIFVDNGIKLDFTDLGDPELPNNLAKTERRKQNSSCPPPATPPPPPPWMGIQRENSVSCQRTTTIRLHWTEAKKKVTSKNVIKSTIWDCIKTDILIDKKIIQNLFKIKDSDIPKTARDSFKKCVLPEKRAHVLNIELTRFPPNDLIKVAILKMDNKILSKDNIEQMSNKMMPSDEELSLIKSLKEKNPEIPLGNAEEFIYCLSEIRDFRERLQIWHFLLEFPGIKQELAEAFYEFKLGMEQLQKSETFKNILGVILCIGNILNVRQAEGFNLVYLTKVGDVKDTQNRQTLLSHVCEILYQRYGGDKITDLYSEIPSIIRSCSIKWEQVSSRLRDLEVRNNACRECALAMEGGRHPLSKQRREILEKWYEEILQLQIIYEKLILRFDNFLHFYTFSNDEHSMFDRFCKVISDFSLEFHNAWESLLVAKRKKERIGKRATVSRQTLCQSEKNEPELMRILSERSRPDSAGIRRRRFSVRTDINKSATVIDECVRNYNSNRMFAQSCDFDADKDPSFR